MYQKPLPKPMYDPTDQGSIRAFTHYKELLEHKYSPRNHTEIRDGDPTHPEHLLWMCIHCIPRIRDDGLGFAPEKYSRWLGFIQGCLICQGFTTVKAEQDRVLPWSKE